MPHSPAKTPDGGDGGAAQDGVVDSHHGGSGDTAEHGNRIYQARETGFKLDDFDLIRVIGRGSYAKVSCSLSTFFYYKEKITNL